MENIGEQIDILYVSDKPEYAKIIAGHLQGGNPRLNFIFRSHITNTLLKGVGLGGIKIIIADCFMPPGDLELEQGSMELYLIGFKLLQELHKYNEIPKILMVSAPLIFRRLEQHIQDCPFHVVNTRLREYWDNLSKVIAHILEASQHK